MTEPLLDVVFPVERDIAGWERRHADGEVPSRWLYGLDSLETYTPVRARSIAEPGLIRRGFHRVTGGILAAGGAARTSLTWDENVARRLLLSGTRGPIFSGMIWLTDRVERMDAAQRRRVLAPLRRLDGVFVNSRAQLGALDRMFGTGGPRLEFLPFGVDSDFFTAQQYPERPLVVSVGGDRDRDAETLFGALELVHRAVPGAEIIVQSASTITPPDGVVVYPSLSHRELRELYGRASVVAIATRPNLHLSGLTVSLESMATARPVVLTAQPGVDDYITSGENALLVPSGDASALADEVIGLLRDPDAAAQLGATARRQLEKRFTVLNLAKSLAGFMRL